MGWLRSSMGVYGSTYMPAIPPSAVLAGHGYRVHEDYNPPWRLVHVPERFLRMVCPEAEVIRDSVKGLSLNNFAYFSNRFNTSRASEPCRDYSSLGDGH